MFFSIQTGRIDDPFYSVVAVAVAVASLFCTMQSPCIMMSGARNGKPDRVIRHFELSDVDDTSNYIRPTSVAVVGYATTRLHQPF